MSEPDWGRQRFERRRAANANSPGRGDEAHSLHDPLPSAYPLLRIRNATVSGEALLTTSFRAHGSRVTVAPVEAGALWLGKRLKLAIFRAGLRPEESAVATDYSAWQSISSSASKVASPWPIMVRLADSHGVTLSELFCDAPAA